MKVIYKRAILTSCIVFALVAVFGKLSAQDLKSALKLTQSERYEDANAAFEALIKQYPEILMLIFI